MKKYILLVIVFLSLAFAGYFFYYNLTYSEGTRAGYLVKVSKKGMVFKTFEGQLNLGGISGGDMSAIVSKDYWEFSIPKSREDIFEEMQNFEGKQIKVGYKQKMGAFFWQGDTDYFVDEVKLVE